MSVCVGDGAVLRLNGFANQPIFNTKHNQDNGCNVLDGRSWWQASRASSV